MPHKHTRKRNPNASNDYNLAPSTLAKPLPAFSGAAQDGKKLQLKRGARRPAAKQPEATLKRKRTGTTDYKEDDTPRAFARLMQFQSTGKRPSGLDDDREMRKAKKRRLATASEAASVAKPEPAAPKEVVPELPKILPGERLSDYNARVDRLLPVSGLARKGNVKVEGVKERVTKKEKQLKKMYASWREEDARIKEKEEEEAERLQEEEEDRRAKFGESYESGVGGSKRRKGREIGEVADDDEDPWAVLKERREKPKGLHDVVQAPPTFTVKPKEKFKVRENAKVEVANVPGKAGSLKRREELGDARRDVIERYRAMMKGKGGL